MNYAMNAWYLAAWSDEVAPRAMLARKMLGVPVLLLRASGGEVSALLDRCPHRFAPLSLGRVSDDGVQCGYHGLRFDGRGHCVDNPHGPVATVARVRRFTVREAYKAVWIWMGDAEANPAMLPDLSFMEAVPDTAFSKGYLHSSGNYQLYTDNIMDLSHVDYLHPSTIGSGAITRTRPTLAESELGVSITWLSMNETLGPLMESVLQLNGALADVWTEVHWSVPSIMRLVHGGVRAGRPREEGVNNLNLHAVTPETESTTHYFFAATRNFRLDDAEFNTHFAQTRRQIFATEDKPMIEAQSERMNGQDFWSLKPGLFSMDRGLVLVRRKLEKLIARESDAGCIALSPTLSSNA